MAYIPYATSYIWQNITEHAKSIVPGHMYLFWYSNWQHDMTPLALVIKYEKEYNTFQAINLHYLHPDIRLPLVNTLDKLGLVNEVRDSIYIDYDLISYYSSEASLFLRRYKLDAIRAPRLIPISKFREKYWRSYGSMTPAIRPEIWHQSKKAFAMTRPSFPPQITEAD